MVIVGHGGKSRKGRRSKSTALIEVQKTVALDMHERQVKDTGDIMEKTKLAVSTEEKSMIQVKEGEVSWQDFSKMYVDKKFWWWYGDSIMVVVVMVMMMMMAVVVGGDHNDDDNNDDDNND